MAAKPTVTWVVVANGSKLRVFESPGTGRGLTELAGEAVDTPHRQTGGEFSDRAGRSHDSHGVGRHAMERVTDPQDQARQNLAREISVRLDAALSEGAYDRLAVVAAPKVLADLRRELSQAIQDRIVCELSKDLTGAEASIIAQALEDKLLV